MIDFDDVQQPSNKIYLDFNRARENSINKHRKLRQGLENILSTLNKKHDQNVLKNWSGDASSESLLDYALRNYFPEKLPVSFFVSNLSLSQEYWRLMIRLPVGPKLQADMPSGLTLAFIAEAGEKQSEQPSLIIRDIKIVADTEMLSFEREVQCEVALNKAAWEARNNNIIDRKWLEGLPKISQKTEKELETWYGYLDFKKQVVQHQELGVRYLSSQVKIEDEKQQVQFIICFEQGDNIINRLKRQQLSCFDITASEDTWTFAPPIERQRNNRVTDVRIGDFKENDSRNLTKEESSLYLKKIEEGVANPQFYRMTFDLCDDHKESIDKQQLTDEQAKEWAENKFPDEGFIAISTAGDKAQINRHERALNQLKNQSGYNPMLSVFLFDINQARIPSSVSEIDRQEFFNQDLNDDQKECVEKMLSAPDICLVQGPPGTGKTTVIAEAIYQLVKKGERVLLVSQAHLAVDNALERLPLDPAIRALRLGPDSKISDGGKQFTKEQVLKRFYQGIDNRVYTNSLGIWNNLKQRKEQCRYYIDKLVGLVGDLNKNKEQTSRLSYSLEKNKNSIQVMQQTLELELKTHQELMSAQKQASNTLKALQEEQWSQCYIPESIFYNISDQVSNVVGVLRNNGLTMNLPLPKQSDSLAVHINVFRSWLASGAAALKFHQLIVDDLIRLKNGEDLKDTATTLEIKELKKKRDSLTELMQGGDESVIEEWREIGTLIKKLEAKKGGLDLSIYNKLVDTHSVLLVSDSQKNEVIQSLELLVTGLTLLKKHYPMLVAQLEDNLTSCIQKNKKEPDRKPLQDAQAIFDKNKRELLLWQERANGYQSKIAATLQLASIKDQLPVNQESPEASITMLQEEEVDCEQRLNNAGFRQQWQPILERWHKLLSVDDISTDNEHFLDDFIPHCNVIAITCNESDRTLENVGAESFDTVIIDEVSKATPPELLAPIMRARRVVLVGDHRQLPPVFQERHDETWEEAAAKAEENGEESLLTKSKLKEFEKMVTSSLFKRHFEEADSSIKSSLFTQYRMHPQIMDLINVFYENRLKCGLTDPDTQRSHGLTIGSAQHSSLTFIRPDSHAYWINSSHLPDGSPFYEQQAGTSKVNPLEVQLIVKTLRKLNLAQQEIILNNNEPKKRVGIISFYGRQVSDLRKAIRPLRSELKYLEVDINTVDQFQGKEEDIILVSMVRNTRSGRSGSGAYVAQFERINVALSRARELLIIYGARELFSNYEVELPNLDRLGTKKGKIYKDIILKINSTGSVFDSNALLHPEGDRNILVDLKRQEGLQQRPKNQQRIKNK